MGVTVRQKEKGKGKSWWIFISHNGRRSSRRVGDKAAAETVRASPFEPSGEVVHALATGDDPGMGIRFVWAEERDRPLPFHIASEDLRLLHYPRRLRIDILDAPTPQHAELRVGGAVPVRGTPYRVRVESFEPDTGDMTYFVEGPAGVAGPYSRGHEEGTPLRVRPTAFREPELRRAEAVVSLRDPQGREIARRTVAVNEPLVHGGLRIYLTAWGRDPDGRPFTGFQVVRDPTQPIVWAGSAQTIVKVLSVLFAGKPGENARVDDFDQDPPDAGQPRSCFPAAR